MEIYKRLKEIGIDNDAVEAIRKNKNEENALLLIALWDDRHEFVD